jgi:hypothetical protein
MVVTRSQARRQLQQQSTAADRAASLQRGLEARARYWIQMLQSRGQGFARQHWPRQYKIQDNSKRHRISDTQPKTERVRTYVRRI